MRPDMLASRQALTAGLRSDRVFCVDLDQTKLISTGQDGKLVISRFDEDLDSCFLRL